jgi:hypothetical protein
MKKIIVTQTIYKDGECPICFDCQKPAIGVQIKCNCGCDEIWCQPCYYKHYRDFVSKITLNRFVNGEGDFNESFSKALS